MLEGIPQEVGRQRKRGSRRCGSATARCRSWSRFRCAAAAPARCRPTPAADHTGRFLQQGHDLGVAADRVGDGPQPCSPSCKPCSRPRRNSSRCRAFVGQQGAVAGRDGADQGVEPAPVEYCRSMAAEALFAFPSAAAFAARCWAALRGRLASPRKLASRLPPAVATDVAAGKASAAKLSSAPISVSVRLLDACLAGPGQILPAAATPGIRSRYGGRSSAARPSS